MIIGLASAAWHRTYLPAGHSVANIITPHQIYESPHVDSVTVGSNTLVPIIAIDIQWSMKRSSKPPKTITDSTSSVGLRPWKQWLDILCRRGNFLRLG